MTEQKSECCSSGCKCGSSKTLLSFLLFVIIILLSGIFYTMQGMVSMCPMKGDYSKKAMCPLMGKSVAEQVK